MQLLGMGQKPVLIFAASGRWKIVPLITDSHFAGNLYPFPASHCPSRGGGYWASISTRTALLCSLNNYCRLSKRVLAQTAGLCSVLTDTSMLLLPCSGQHPALLPVCQSWLCRLLMLLQQVLQNTKLTSGLELVLNVGKQIWLLWPGQELWLQLVLPSGLHCFRYFLVRSYLTFVLSVMNLWSNLGLWCPIHPPHPPCLSTSKKSTGCSLPIHKEEKMPRAFSLAEFRLREGMIWAAFQSGELQIKKKKKKRNV